MLPKIRCKDCGYRLDNSNYCLKRFQVISVKRPKRCKDFVPKTKFKFSIEVKEEERKVIATPKKIESFLSKVVFTPIEIEKKTKVPWWKRLIRWIRIK